jgi:hypothetical protein
MEKVTNQDVPNSTGSANFWLFLGFPFATPKWKGIKKSPTPIWKEKYKNPQLPIVKKNTKIANSQLKRKIQKFPTPNCKEKYKNPQLPIVKKNTKITNL